MDEARKAEPGSLPREGATTDLPHDRITLERFRRAFPRARWSDKLNAWFVPGRTAEKRINRWLAEMEAKADAFAFEPIVSGYLEAAPAHLKIRTPFSKTVVSEIREIPHARWDADGRLWTVPYRSLAELRCHWPAIEAAAERNGPDARRARNEAIRGTEEQEAAKARMKERRRKRYPVPARDPPPFHHAVATHIGIVFFVRSDGELADRATVSSFYFGPAEGKDYVWAFWRSGSLEELVTTWPARSPAEQRERDRGWWMPTLEELRIARRDAKSRRRARERKEKDNSSSRRPADSA